MIAANGKTNPKANAALMSAPLTMEDVCTLVQIRLGDSGVGVTQVTHSQTTRLALVSTAHYLLLYLVFDHLEIWLREQQPLVFFSFRYRRVSGARNVLADMYQ